MRKKTPTDGEFAVMRLLVDKALYGLDIVKLSGGAIKRGSVYVYMQRMLAKGLVAASDDLDPELGGMRRPKYRLTPDGKRWISFMIKDIA